MDPQQAQQQAAHILAVILPMIVLAWVVGAAVIVVPFWQIFKKAGMSPALSFLMILPIVNLVMIYVLAFSRWKVIPASSLPFMPQQGYPPAAYPPVAYPPVAYAQPPAPYAAAQPPVTAPAPQAFVEPEKTTPDEPTGL